MPDFDILVEILYFSGGLKNFLIGGPEDVSSMRPHWLPSYELIGLKNDVQLKRDEYAIELSRFKRENFHVTWIGVFSFCEDAIYGDRSNYAGVGVWLKDLYPSDTESIVDALLKICDNIPQSGPQNLISHCRRLVREHDYMPSWVGSLRDLPKLDGGLRYDIDGLPRTAYIGIEREAFRDELKAVCNSLLIHCFQVDSRLSNVTRLLYLVVHKNQAPRSGQDVLPLVDPHVGAAILAYFRSSIAELRAEKSFLIEDCDRLRVDVGRHRTEIDSREEEVRLLKSKNADLENENSKLRNRGEKQLDSYAKAFNALYARVEKDLRDELSRSCLSRDKSLQSADRVISGLPDAISGFQRELNDAKRERRSTESSLKRWERILVWGLSAIFVAILLGTLIDVLVIGKPISGLK